MSEDEETKPAWPRVRKIGEAKNARGNPLHDRAGAHKAKNGGGVMQKHEARLASVQARQAALDELEMYKHAHHNLACFLEGIVRQHGPQRIPLDLLERECRYGNLVITPDEATQSLMIRLKPPEAVPEPPPPEVPAELPAMPESAPKPLSALEMRPNEVVRDGRIMHEYVTSKGDRYVAEINNDPTGQGSPVDSPFDT